MIPLTLVNRQSLVPPETPWTFEPQTWVQSQELSEL